MNVDFSLGFTGTPNIFIPISMRCIVNKVDTRYTHAIIHRKEDTDLTMNGLTNRTDDGL